MSNPPVRVSLRAPLPEDVEARVALGISAEINRMYGYLEDGTSTMTLDEAAGWYDRLQSHPCAWVVEADGELVGEVRLDNIDKHDLRARLAIGLYNERHLGLGIGRMAIDLLVHKAFGPLALHRVDLRVLSYNLRAIRCYEACGFVREGIERESARVGDEWHDDWIMGILERDFQARLTTE